MYKPIVATSTTEGSSIEAFAATSAQLPIVLTHATNMCVSGVSIVGESCEAICDNSSFIACFNYLFIISKLRLFSSSTSLLHHSFRFSLISTNCCGVIDADEVLEPHNACPKLIVTLVLATRIRPGCSGRPIAVFNMSSRPSGIKLPCVICSCKESCKSHKKDLHFNLDHVFIAKI